MSEIDRINSLKATLTAQAERQQKAAADKAAEIAEAAKVKEAKAEGIRELAGRYARWAAFNQLEPDFMYYQNIATPRQSHFKFLSVNTTQVIKPGWHAATRTVSRYSSFDSYVLHTECLGVREDGIAVYVSSGMSTYRSLKEAKDDEIILFDQDNILKRIAEVCLQREGLSWNNQPPKE